MKKIFLFLLLTVFVVSGCGQNKGINGDNSTGKKGDIGKAVCEEFDADFVYSVIKLPIKNLVPSALGADHGCQYQTKTMEADKTNEFVAIYFENLSVETNKKGMEILERKLSTDSRIKMEHYIAWQSADIINGIYLVINPNRFVRIDRSSTKVITNDQNIELAAKVAEKLNGNLQLKIEKNPVALEEVKVADQSASQEQVVSDFLNALATKDIQKALGMMDANQDTKQAWGVNFNSIKSLEIKSLDEVYKEDWTSARQSFKAILNVQVSEQGLQMGWQNGENHRWITVEKNGDIWQIHELANNP